MLSVYLALVEDELNSIPIYKHINAYHEIIILVLSLKHTYINHISSKATLDIIESTYCYYQKFFKTLQ